MIYDDQTKVILGLDRRSYSVDATQKAAYNFIDRLVIVVSTVGDIINCEIEAVLGTKVDFNILLQDFKRELLDQELRFKIKAETEAVRNLVLAYTFSRTDLQG